MNINADRYNNSWQEGRGQEYYKGYKKNPKEVSAAEEKKETEKASAENQTEKTCREQILEKMAEMAQKVKDGTVEPTFQIGAMSYTMKEWDKLLEKFDAAEEALQAEVRAQIKEAEMQAAKEALRREAEGKAGMQSTVTAVAVTETEEPEASESVAGRAQNESGTLGAANAAEPVSRPRELDAEQTAVLLTDEVTKCSYPTDDPGQKHWFITAYGKDGISCKEAYFDGTKWVNKDCWSLPFTGEGQYEKVLAFLKRFPTDANLRFASHENFWKDFLAGEIDEEDFAAFFATTKDGVPDYTYTENGSTYIDREKIKYAKYMNDFGAHFYTAEEMELIQKAVIHENQKSLRRLSDDNKAMAIPGDGGKPTAEEEDEPETQIVTKPDGAVVLRISTPYGEREIEIGEARKWGLRQGWEFAME